MKALLRYKADRRSILISMAALGAIALPFCVDLIWPMTVLWPLLNYLLAFSACTINHNHIHKPTFYSRRMNLLFQIVLSLAKGHSSSTGIVPHNFNHHRFNGKEEDWISTDIAGDGIGAVRMMRYIFRASQNMAKGRSLTYAPKLSARKRWELWLERACLGIFVCVLCYLSIVTAIGYVFIPWMLSMLTLLGINLLQHDGCDPDSLYNESRNFTSSIGNWFLFNNGYHTIHHLKPTLHWSLLPEMHAKMIARHIDPALIEPSILKFVLRNYTLFPTSCIGTPQANIQTQQRA